MSRYLSIDGEEGEQVASNAGWSQFIAWVGSLEGSPTLKAFVQEGGSENPDGVTAELDAAFEATPPADPETFNTADGLLTALQLADEPIHIAITNGMVEDE